MAVGIVSVAHAVPGNVRRNNYWLERYPELVARAEEQSLAQVWKRREAGPRNHFDVVMEPYLGDPFRGTVERRILGLDDSGLGLEVEAARRALAAAEWTTSDVDLLFVSSFLPEHYGPGNAAYVVRDLGLRCPGINLESACSSALVAMNTAIGLVEAGHYRNALVLASCSYSRMSAEDDSLSWFLGDGAGAFLIAEVPDASGFRAAHTVHTAQTCGTFRLDMVVDEQLGPVPRMAASKGTARIINDTGEAYLREACGGALAKAGWSIEDVDFLAVNTPTAWYADFACDVLGLDRSRSFSTYPRFANVGAALLPINLREAAEAGRLRAGDRVLMYAVGSVSTAVATALRWGEVGLG